MSISVYVFIYTILYIYIYIYYYCSIIQKLLENKYACKYMNIWITFFQIVLAVIWAVTARISSQELKSTPFGAA